jgi:tetratricopeptide (TPR) repeat protein
VRTARGEAMYCQACGARNVEESEHCWRCQQKLLIVSGPLTDEDKALDPESEDEAFSLDEHLLERVSILEEAVKRTAETVRQLLTAVAAQERAQVLNQTGLTTLRELLEEKQVLHHAEWTTRWEVKMEYQLLALEKRERFEALKDRILARFRGKKRQEFEGLIEEAEYALFGLDIERALSALEAAYKLDRVNYDLAYFLGETYFNEGDTAVALAFFERVLQVQPEHFEGLVYSGVIHQERGDSDAAEKALRRAVDLYPDQFLPLFSLGAVCAGLGRLVQAVDLLERAVAIDGVTQARYLLGNCLYEMGRRSEAIRVLRDVVRQDPAHEEAHHLLGLAYLDRHWNRKALDAFRHAQHLNPSKMRYQDLVRYLSGQGRSPLPEVGPEARRWLEQGEELLAADKAERALGAYRRAMQAEPENPTLLMSYALACMQLERHGEGEAVTRQVLDLDPEPMLKATAYATLIEALRSSGRLREGNQVGRRLLDEGSSAYARTIGYYEMAINLAELEEDLDEALDYAQRALELSPEELRQFPLAAAGWVHYKRREFEAAIDYLERSNELGASPTTLTHLGMALLASGDEDGARQVLERARRLDRGGHSLEQRMMECLKASDRLLARVRRGRGRD